ncbi:hypothetical protein DOJK_02340 [Patescibacteria group bacterium]|nr:hypothetical protein [Candidatus Dojkabacteria bacterium]CAG1023435.1 hypothetical protein DOJK_02340 [Patescibacteria group bacterium]
MKKLKEKLKDIKKFLKKDKRRTAIIGVILIVILISAGIFFQVQRNNSTSPRGSREAGQTRQTTPRTVTVTGRIVSIDENKIAVVDRRNLKTEAVVDKEKGVKIASTKGSIAYQDLKVNDQVIIFAKVVDGVNVLERIRIRE